MPIQAYNKSVEQRVYLEEIGSSDETGDVGGADPELFAAAHVEKNQFECFGTDLRFDQNFLLLTFAHQSREHRSEEETVRCQNHATVREALCFDDHDDIEEQFRVAKQIDRLETDHRLGAADVLRNAATRHRFLQRLDEQ